ncbi:MAG: thioredoxin-disulfide reductase [Ruminococcaceae bacterium]|nr:thioredoxin-disulfide reductase [Oscillospiraceae bacterium]
MKYDIVIVGGGPAGMTAALYAARAGKSVVLFEGEALGGQILPTRKIENYPALPEVDGYTFADGLTKQITALGVVIVYATVSKIEKIDVGFTIFANDEAYSAKAVILATGLKHRKLGLDGEDALIGRGVSFCATCDGMFFRKKEVAVVGGGNTAVQDALVLSEYCSRVYLIHRRAELRAEKNLAEQMRAKENIEFIGETVIEELEGKESLQSLTLRNVATGAVEYLPVSALFEAIGQLPQNAAFFNLVDLDEDGYFLTDNECRTSCPGIFAAGDACRKNVRQLTTAVSDGTVAALSAVEYLR